MDRRNFLKVAGATGALVAVSPSSITQKLYASNGMMYTAYERVQLVDGNGAPIKASQLKKEINYVFNYPHVGTPALLLNLEDATATDVKLTAETGEEYVWKSGVGKERSIVAYSAICSHQLAHPTPSDSFLQYVQKTKKTMAYDTGGVIVCSSHLSAFDAKAGAKRLSGPAVDALASVVIEVADDDSVWAVGVLGVDRFHDYFKSFKPEFKEFYGGKRKAKKLVKISAKTVVLNEYTKEIIQY
ncbi:MAG: twin-arginine translocation signal domain-containing protein [Campylobacterota bacterium]|nr:twin-arginine translocation signal domain-containing protein [Campylobacterota bacterium]